MAKRLNMFILIMLMVSQTILGPLASSSAVFAEGNGNNDEEETEVNKDELKELLEDVAELEEADYSVESFEALKEATEDAEEVFENDEATQEEVDEAFDELEEAVEELAVDKTALTTLLDDNADVAEEDYTADSFAEFVDALTAGENVVDDADATQKVVNDAETEIEKALDALKKQTTDEEGSDTEESSEETGDEEGSEEDSETKESNEEKITTAAADDGPQEITENIIDEIILKRADGSIYEEGDQLDPNEDLELGLVWSLPNDPMYKGGDTFTFQLPEQLAIYSEITGDLGNFGTFVVTEDGEVTFTFNDMINENSNVKGTFWVKTELDKQKFTSSTETLEFVFNDDVTKKITINVKPEKGQAIHKEGQPVDGNFNTDEIQWTVLINTTKDQLENAIVTDPIGDGQELDLDSIELKEIEVNLAGEKVADLGSVDLANIDKSTVKELKFELGDTNKAYELTFKTKMEESEKDREGWLWYSNTAYLNSDGKDQKESGTGVSVQRPESLTKTSSEFDAEDRSVEWTVNANFTEKQLKAGDTITDEFNFTVDGENKNDVFTVIEDKIEIEQVDSFDNNGNPTEKSDAKNLFDITIDGNKVTYTLKEDTSSAFIIKYKTIAEDGVYINKNGEISNKIEIDGKTADSSQGVHQQVGDKWIHEINYETKEIEWKIRVNADKQDLKNFILTDNFSGAGQKLVENSIDIDPDTSGAQISPDADGEGFEIDFGDIKDTYLITYKTEFTYDFADEDKPNFKNGLNIKYDTGDPDNPYELEIEREREPNEETRNNGVKNGTANNKTKEITWTVDVNYNNLTLTDAKVIDEIADNQSLIDGSVKVYETSINKEGKIETGDDVTEDFDVTAEENLVEVLFSGEIDQSHRIEFKTKDKDDIYNSDEVYENTAQFIPREGEEHNLKATVTLPNQGEFLGKSGLHNKEDWTVDWTIDVNKSQSKLNGVTVKDDLGDDGSQILLEDSFKVTKAGSDEELDEDAYELIIDGNAFSVKFDGEITDAYEITYSSYILAGETANLKNKAEIESVEEEITGTVEKEEEVEVKISTGGGTAEGSTGGLTLEKTEKGTDRPLEGVKFTLLTTIGDQKIVVREDTTDEDGKIEWTGLRYGDYTLKEEIPEGYTGKETQEVTIDNDSLEDGVLTLKDEIVNERQTGIAKIIKIDAVTDEELPGAEFEITNETTGQKYTLTTEDDGTISKEVPYGEYTVEEVTAPNGYRIIEDIDNITIEVDETTEVTIENEAFVDVDGEKTWVTSEDEENPDSITVELLTNGTKTDEQEVSASDDWKYSFTDLDKYDKDGEEIEYTIAEVEVDGYNTHQDGYDLTNIETTEVSGTKTWVDDNSNERPDEITVKLLADGKEVSTEKANAESDWEYEFTDLDKFDENGEEIKYTIEEIEIAGYKADINGFDITNLRVGTVSVEGEKTWLDEDPTDRPKSITVNLSREVDEEVDEDFAESKTVEPNDKGEWTYEFKDLDEFDENGAAYTYKVEEADVPENYESNVKGYDITNVRIGETEVSGTKRWKDDTVESRPDEITINLLRNNVVLDTKEVSADDNWKYTFTGLDEYDDEGQLYEYTVKEQDVEGYNSDVKDTDITNTRAEKKDIEVNKAWLDDESEERPESIVVYLKQNGNNFDTVELKADNDWKYEFTDLEAFDENGHAYSYSVEEKAIEGYETTIDGFDIQNLRVGETEVSGTKTWLDDDSEDRPEEITVKLLANGEETDQTVTVDADSDWTYEFTGLDQYDDQGKEIKYSVDEEAVEGYEKSIDGNNLTNLRVGKTEVTGEKDWVEVDERYRPDSITVQLLANGEPEDTFEVSDETDWSYGFTGLEKYDDQGKEITYTVEELDVPTGYDSKEDGYIITNTQQSTEVSGEKKWEEVDERYRPDTIIVQLLANGEEEATVEVSAESDWTYEFTDLAKYDKSGEEIVYTVTELDIPAGYTAEVDGFDITNTQETTEVAGEKVWKEVDESYRPDSITVQLLANGEEEATIEVSSETDWKYAFTNLAKYDKDGAEIDYTVKESNVPKGYDSEVDGNDITNTQKTTEIKGSKTWVDEDESTRPTNITIQLKNGDKVVDEKEISSQEKEFTFKNLPKYNKEGKVIEYKVDEKRVSEYNKSVEDFDITNTQKTYAIGDYTWIDRNKDGKQDENEEVLSGVIVELYDENDKKIAETTTDKNGRYIFDELVAGDYKVKFTLTEKQAKKYKFTKQNAGEDTTVDSDADAETGWTKVIKLNEKNGYLTPDEEYEYQDVKATEGIDPTWDAGVIELVDITITKDWEDKDESTRPASITVDLYANDEATEYELTAENDWKLTIEGLDKYDTKGEEIVYTVEEHNVSEYNSKVTGDAAEGFTVTNTQKTYAIGDYTWIDRNKDGIQDENEEVLKGVKVELIDENGDVIDTTTTDEKGLYIFDELVAGEYKVKFTLTDKQAKKYKFTKQNAGDDTTVDSDADEEGWTTKITLNEKDNKQLTKEYDAQDFKATEGIDPTWDAGVIELVEVSGTKTWVNDHNESEELPESITVNLLANGEDFKSQEVTAEDDWKYSFTGLDKYDEAGEKIKYSITEDAVDGYETSYDGNNITNTKVCESFTVEVEDENGDPVTEEKYTFESEDGKKITKKTDKDGKVAFDREDLPEGKYTVKDKDGNKVGEINVEYNVDCEDNVAKVIVPVEKPEDPTEPKDEEEVETTVKVDGKPSEEDKGGLGGILPKTATNTFNLLLAGALLLVAGTGFILFRRRKAE